MQKFVRKRRFKHFPEFSVITDFDNVKYTRLQVKLSEIMSEIRNTNIKTMFCKRAVLG